MNFALDSFKSLKGGSKIAAAGILLIFFYYISISVSSNPVVNLSLLGSGNQENDGVEYTNIGVGYPQVLVLDFDRKIVYERVGTLYAYYVNFDPRSGDAPDDDDVKFISLIDVNRSAAWNAALDEIQFNEENASHWYTKSTYEWNGSIFLTVYQPFERIPATELRSAKDKYHKTLNEPPFTSEMPIFLSNDVVLPDFFNGGGIVRLTITIIYSETDVGKTQLISYDDDSPPLANPKHLMLRMPGQMPRQMRHLLGR
jgi:hypothetical protein